MESVTVTSPEQNTFRAIPVAGLVVQMSKLMVSHDTTHSVSRIKRLKATMCQGTVYVYTEIGQYVCCSTQ